MKNVWLLSVGVLLFAFACQNSHELVQQDTGWFDASSSDGAVDSSVMDAQAMVDGAVFDAAIDAETTADSALGDAGSDAADSTTDAHHATVEEFLYNNPEMARLGCRCIPSSYYTPEECLERQTPTARENECSIRAYTPELAQVQATLDCITANRRMVEECMLGISSCSQFGSGQPYYDMCNAIWTENRCYGYAYEVSQRIEQSIHDCNYGPSGNACPDQASSALGDDVFVGNNDRAGDDFMQGGPDLAFQWTAPYAGNFRVDTSASDFPVNVLVRYGNDACSNWDRYSFVHPHGGTSKLVVNAAQGERFLFIAYPENARTFGAVRVSIHPNPPDVCQPFNASSALGRAVIVGDSRLFNDDRQTCEGMRGEPWRDGDYEWIAPYTGNFRFEVGFQEPLQTTVQYRAIGVYRGGCESQGELLDCSGFGNGYVRGLVAGEKIRLRVQMEQYGAPFQINVYDLDLPL